MIEPDRVPEPLIAQATALLESLAWHGDHGFTGAQWEAWRFQRSRLLHCLLTVVDGQFPTALESHAARSSPCPRKVVDEMVEEEHEVTHEMYCDTCEESFDHSVIVTEEVENEDWCNGSEDGADWVADSAALLERVENQRADRERIMKEVAQ